MTPAQQHHYDDFTEENYRRLLRLARQRFAFVDYAHHDAPGHNVLWRHDVDYSVQRSLALARIEHEEGVHSTFFMYPHCYFYNFFETDVLRCAREILSLGHSIGLHADLEFTNARYEDNAARQAFVRQEVELMEEALDHKLTALSFHQPELRNVLGVTSSHFAGLVNVYSKEIFDRYTYCSDSNGHWRHRRLEDVLCDESISDLQVLTHPAWWTPTAMSPAARIMRCIDERGKAAWKRYCDELAASGRAGENYGAEEFL